MIRRRRGTKKKEATNASACICISNLAVSRYMLQHKNGQYNVYYTSLAPSTNRSTVLVGGAAYRSVLLLVPKWDTRVVRTPEMPLLAAGNNRKSGEQGGGVGGRLGNMPGLLPPHPPSLSRCGGNTTMYCTVQHMGHCSAKDRGSPHYRTPSSIPFPRRVRKGCSRPGLINALPFTERNSPASS